jgi:hypothetical protein
MTDGLLLLIIRFCFLAILVKSEYEKVQVRMLFWLCWFTRDTIFMNTRQVPFHLKDPNSQQRIFRDMTMELDNLFSKYSRSPSYCEDTLQMWRGRCVVTSGSRGRPYSSHLSTVAHAVWLCCQCEQPWTANSSFCFMFVCLYNYVSSEGGRLMCIHIHIYAYACDRGITCMCSVIHVCVYMWSV